MGELLMWDINGLAKIYIKVYLILMFNVHLIDQHWFLKLIYINVLCSHFGTPAYHYVCMGNSNVRYQWFSKNVHIKVNLILLFIC